MSFENGYNMFDYCGNIFEKYRKDSMIFCKALQLFDYFRERVDYPYCTSELSDVCERVLGYELDWLSDFVWKYSIPMGKHMEWDARNVLTSDEYKDGNMIGDLDEVEGDKLVQDFKNEMEAFFIATTPLFEELFMAETNSMKLSKIAVKKTYGEEKTVRFIREDGRKIDFSVDKQGVQKIIDVLSGL